MRPRAGLALIAGACFGAVAPPADAANYCAGSVPDYYGCSASFAGIQEALDAAASQAGADTVLIAGGEHSLSDGVVYSDLGQADNGVTITRGAPCEKYGCGTTTLAGGTPGGTLLAFSGGGGAEVRVDSIEFRPGHGVTGLMLPAGGVAELTVIGSDGSIGVRTEGTDARPATVGGNFTQVEGGASDIAIDAPGAALVDHALIQGDIAARSRGSDGLLEIRNATINASVGVTGRKARLSRSVVDLRGRAGPVLGFEAVCADAAAPDAEITGSNVTVIGSGGTGSTGARAIGQGGDGDSCDATVRLNSTILAGVRTSLDGTGEAGSGADPRNGVAGFDMDYSSFDPGAITQVGPVEVDTGNPGGNVYGDPGLNPRFPFGDPSLSWDSPLIDHGDPAPLEGWEQFFNKAVNGRRDIGAREYGFWTPEARPLGLPQHPIRRGGVVVLSANAFDADWDPIDVRWTFSNGDHAQYVENGFPLAAVTVKRRYWRLGTHVEEVTVTDPTGRSSTARAEVRVVRQRMKQLSIAPRRVRPPGLASVPTDNVITFRTRIPDTVYFRLERGVRRPHSRRRLQWVRTPYRFKAKSNLAASTTLSFNGYVRGRVVRPGRYRLVAAPRGVRPLRARLRVLRVLP